MIKRKWVLGPASFFHLVKRCFLHGPCFNERMNCTVDLAGCQGEAYRFVMLLLMGICIGKSFILAFYNSEFDYSSSIL